MEDFESCCVCPQLDDMTVTVETQRGQISQLEKKQKKFDAVCSIHHV